MAQQEHLTRRDVRVRRAREPEPFADARLNEAMDKILLVEDDVRQQRAIATLLKKCGYEVLTAAGCAAASRLLAQVPDIIVTDLNLAGADGLEVLREAHQVLPETPVIITTGYGSIASAVNAMKQGAFDYLTKPTNPEELLLVIQRAAERSQLQREVRRLRQQLGERDGLLGIVGNSEPMRRVFEQLHLVAPTRSTDLITGESGTGKELVARAIHQLSPRRDGPFVALNCAAIPKDLAESELFGHARGAFTGATERRLGKFAAADRRTLLIDEIGEMELPVQAKLLRALETRTISPVGSNEEQPVDVRVVAATHHNLQSLVDAGKFREDLFYRLNVVHIGLPALRQRLQRDFDTLFERLLGGRLAPFEQDFGSMRLWDFDVTENDKEIVVRAELPGFEPNELDVQFNQDVLTIKAEKQQKGDREEEYRSFYRTVTLPPGIKADKAQATYRNGVLELHIPRSEEAQPKRIRVEGQQAAAGQAGNQGQQAGSQAGATESAKAKK
jgi:DNA-binding NtrC family response regulator